MENTQLGDWLELSDAIGATGLTARSLQRYAKAGKVEREVRALLRERQRLTEGRPDTFTIQNQMTLLKTEREFCLFSD